MKVSILVKAFRGLQFLMNKDRVARKMPTYDTVSIDDINYFGESPKAKGYERHLLDTYSPKEVYNEEKLPVIVEVHGGGYTTCYKEINRQHGMWFAAHGYRVVNINYTLLPEGTIAEEMQEIRGAFSWMEEHAEEYGFDLDRLYLTGDSSGGHLALLFASIQNRPDLQRALNVKPMTHPLKAVAATCPVGTFVEKDVVSLAISKLLLGSKFFSENDAEILSYHQFLDGHMIPTYLVTAETDIGIHAVTEKIHHFMEEQGIEHTYACYEKQEHKLPHVFNVLNPDWVESVQANKDILAFFKEHE